MASRLLKIPDGTAPWYNDTHRDVNQRSVKKSTFSFYLPYPQSVKLEVIKGSKIVFEKLIEGKTGLNQFRWDLLTKENNSDSPYFIHYKEYLATGEYKVKLTGDEYEQVQDWRVNPGKIPHNW